MVRGHFLRLESHCFHQVVDSQPQKPPNEAAKHSYTEQSNAAGTGHNFVIAIGLVLLAAASWELFLQLIVHLKHSTTTKLSIRTNTE